MTDKAPASDTWLACHCCAKSFPAENVVRFHNHPEDALCVSCVEWLHNRSRPIARRLSPLWPGWQLPARIRARFAAAR